MNINLIALLIQIPFHELGHYVYLRIMGFKPDIKIRWWGIEIGENIIYQLKPVEAYWANASGILAGLIVLVMMGVNNETYLGYVILCGIDFVNIIQLISLPKKYMDMTMLEISKDQLKEIEKKMKNEKRKTKPLF